MTENLTISSKVPKHPGMNFALLRQEGIKQIERLAGNIWTDYNTHDPGITILEQLCYAITDLSYRLDFEMKDLLAPLPGESRKQFFTAKEILTVNPLTINDYRKLLIDIDGVQNAWLEPLEKQSPEIYYDSDRHTLTFESSEFTKPIKLNGLYRVMIEKDDDRVFDDETLLETVKAKLNQYRNLCEDFAQIEILPTEEITINAELEIEEGFDLENLIAKMQFELETFISPSVEFSSLEELLERGKTPETIFEGPPLEHGFIDEEQFRKCDRKQELHTSDLIQIILDIEGIKTVKSITLSSNQESEGKIWALDLDPDSTPKLKNISRGIKDITFYKGQIICTPNLKQVINKLESLRQEKQKSLPNIKNQNIPIPVGEYRELSDYESIQNDFPENYSIGELGLPTSASIKRKAQAKQLQAYLMFFEQLLANYFAQLDRVKDLFSLDNQSNKTYFSQTLSEFPGVKAIFTSTLKETKEDRQIDIERRNRFLDHLIAQYCEKFTDYSLLLYRSILEEKLIDNKVAFLENYPQISADRGRGFNYTKLGQVQSIDDNVSGLKQRICSLLGIPYTRKSLASNPDTEGFHLVEHILLRPFSSETTSDDEDRDQSPHFLRFYHHISEFKPSSRASNTRITCTSPQHGLTENDYIQIFGTENYNGNYTVTNIKPDTFEIEIATAFTTSETAQWAKLDASPEPYSFQISFVLPDWLPRFKNKNFRQLIHSIINAEIPAHITPYYLWLDRAKMQEFERVYTHWLNTITDKDAPPFYIKAVTNNLIQILQMGTVDVASFKVIGYMKIGTNFDVF